jgi:hypothetical protein
VPNKAKHRCQRLLEPVAPNQTKSNHRNFMNRTPTGRAERLPQTIHFARLDRGRGLAFSLQPARPRLRADWMHEINCRCGFLFLGELPRIGTASVSDGLHSDGLPHHLTVS